jgi:glycosyltransferase involved in cell wall biosynthesis
MKIALIYDAVFPFVVGGAEQRNHELARAWAREHQVSLYGFAYWGQDDPPGAGTAPGAGPRYVGVGPPVPLYDANGRRRIAEALLFAARLFRPLLRASESVWDISNFPFFSVPVARLLSLLRGKRLVVTWHEFWGAYWNQYLGWRGIFGRLVERLALWCSPHILTVSEHTRRRLIAAGYPRRRITVIPNGLDWQEIQEVPPASEGADLVYAGRLVPHKQVDLLLRAVARAGEQGRRLTLDVIGDGPERGRLERLAAELRVADRVRFVGRLPAARDVFARFKACKVLVLASQREGFGLVVIQAWACGLPVVVADEPHSAAVELVDEPGLGRVTPPTPQAIADACGELLDRDTEQDRRRRVEASRAFDWSRIAERVLDAYRSFSREGRP